MIETSGVLCTKETLVKRITALKKKLAEARAETARQARTALDFVDECEDWKKENKRLRAVVNAAKRIQAPKELSTSCLEMEIYCALQIELDVLDRVGGEKT